MNTDAKKIVAPIFNSLECSCIPQLSPLVNRTASGAATPGDHVCLNHKRIVPSRGRDSEGIRSRKYKALRDSQESLLVTNLLCSGLYSDLAGLLEERTVEAVRRGVQRAFSCLERTVLAVDAAKKAL